MKLILKILIGLLLITSTLWVFWRIDKITDIAHLEKNVRFPYNKAEVSYPENYDSLVFIELNNETPYDFIKTITTRSEVRSLSFPYFAKTLNYDETQELLSIIYDSSSYQWGELGTPEYNRIIYFFGEEGNDTTGYTIIDNIGEIENYPYRSLMKWGALSEKGKTRLFNAID